MNLVESVAYSICVAFGEEPDSKSRYIDGAERWQDYMEAAVAAIEVMYKIEPADFRTLPTELLSDSLFGMLGGRDEPI